MAKSILQQLFDGEIYPSENIRCKDPKYTEATHALSDEKDYFRNSLSEGDCERFTRLDDLYYEVAGMYSYECFAHGFRLGVTLLIEALHDTDNSKCNGDK